MAWYVERSIILMIIVLEEVLYVSTHLYDVLQVGAHPRAGITLSLQVVQEGGDMFIIHAPQMLQHGTSTGRDWAQQAHGTASVFPYTELPALNNVNAIDEGLDLLGQFLRTR